ncbi:hypothetical protein BDY19DRAFT_45054 [Irpex rosettiformis]|uniref:Uncharacterized protein n=1 Tax=Irpex rosettiformis TaxID=378272 RepID=A0ACB8UKM1_9APHY|nr:hypothetical protein BDY19DRAFT_45054 [Irpex rosettiformis]
MSTPAEALQEDELNLSDLIHTSSPSPAPRSHFVSTPQTSMPASGPSPIPVLTLVCKRTNQPLTPPVQTQVSPRALQMASWSLAALSSPREHSSNTFQPVAFELPSQTPQVHKDNDCSPHALPAPSPISSSYPSVPPAHSPAFSLSEIQQSHATITHLTQQLTLLKHQRDLLTHQRDIFIAQREEERVKFDAQRAAWERLAEALIAQNARESAAGIGRKAVETAEKYALRVEDDNRSLRQKLLDANTRLTTLEKELDRLRPLLMVCE